MARPSFCFAVSATSLLAGACLLASGPAPQTKPGLDLSEYRTVATAKTATVAKKASAGPGQTGYLGVAVERDAQGRLVVDDVQPGSPGDKAGIKKGDLVTRVGDHAVSSAQGFREWLQSYNAGDAVKIGLVREDKALEVTATLAATSRPMTPGTGGGKGGGKGAPALALWQKPVFRFAVIGIEFSDVKHNAKVSTKDWEDALFSTGTYVSKKSATGQRVFGSLNDYFREQSAGTFHLEGQMFEWVDVGKKRGDYIQGSGTSNKTAVLTDALAKVVARDGKDAFKGCDGFFFLYAGEVYRTNAGAVYYPHAGGVQHDGSRWPYLIGVEGGPQMTPVGGFAKLTGLILGLPNLAARTEDVGSRGLGAWCALSNPLTEGRPQHFCAWAKEKIGWIQPAVIDPTVKQKLLLSPIEDSPKECFKVLVRPNGSEYLLLENRRKKGFDKDLPGEGLLIWRVVNGRPSLCESHGVEGPSGPLVHLHAVPFPSDYNTAFTPETTPSSRSPLGGGLPVHITEIRRLDDGGIAFSIGYEYR